MFKPRRSEFCIDSSLHAAMDKWAKTQRRETLALMLKIEGGEEFLFETFKPWTRKVKYKALDDRTYEIEIDAPGYDPGFLETYEGTKKRNHGMRLLELHKQINAWLRSKSVKAKFRLVKEPQ